MPKLTTREARQAQINYDNYILEFHNGKHDHLFNAFWDFVGNPVDQTPNDPDYTFDESACRKIQMLNSQHAHALLKAYEVMKDRP